MEKDSSAEERALPASVAVHSRKGMDIPTIARNVCGAGTWTGIPATVWRNAGG